MDRHEGIGHASGVPGGGTLLAHPEVPHTPLCRTHIFAPNHVVAQFRFWNEDEEVIRETAYRGVGEVATVCGRTLASAAPRFPQRHDTYQEYWNLATAGAVTQCYRDLGARHLARAHSIQS